MPPQGKIPFNKPIPNAMQLLPKTTEMPTDDNPCIRPLTDAETLIRCKQIDINPALFEHFKTMAVSCDKLASVLPSKAVVKMLLVRDVTSLESVDIATKTAQKIAASDEYTPEQQLFACKVIAELQTCRERISEYLLKMAEKAEERVKKEKPRNQPPSTMAVQVNVTGQAPAVSIATTKSDSLPDGQQPEPSQSEQ